MGEGLVTPILPLLGAVAAHGAGVANGDELGGSGLVLPHSQGFWLAQREWWAWWIFWWGLGILAYLTNPPSTSFRTHLTSLSFHTHLRRLSSSSSTASPNGTTSSTAHTTGSSKTSQPPHVLSFSNRISLSIRTPNYKIVSYGFFSVALMGSHAVDSGNSSTSSSSHGSASPASASASSTSTKNASTTSSSSSALSSAKSTDSSTSSGSAEDGTIWIGVFGKWYCWKSLAAASSSAAGASVDGAAVREEEGMKEQEEEKRERRERVEKGLLGVKVCDRKSGKDNKASPADTPPQSPTSPTSAASHLQSALASNQPNANRKLPNSKSTTNKGPAFKAGQRRPSPSSLARLKNKAAGGSHGHSPSHSGGSGTNAQAAAEAAAAAAAAAVAAVVGPNGVDEDFGLGSAGKEGEVDPVLEELKSQLEELRVSSEEGEKKLRDELEVLKGKKREEDAFRAELKSRTKVLEEQKREAEVKRHEAERELLEKRGGLREVVGDLEGIKGEVKGVERRMEEGKERKEKKKRERKEREKKLREDVARKKEELKKAEEGLDKLGKKVEALEKTIEARRELLVSRREEARRRERELNGGGMFRRSVGVGGPMGGGVYGAGIYGGMGNTSRPSSIRSGHFDHHGPGSGPNSVFPTSAPGSPTLSHPVSPVDDISPYSDAAFYAHPLPPPIPSSTSTGGFAPDPYHVAPLHSQGFLEHRLAHRRTELGVLDSTSFVPISGTLPSVDDIPANFLPFDFDDPSPSGLSSGGSNSRNSILGSDDLLGKGGRPQLSLPLQYLDSGLLDGGESAMEGPLSPMTPHQASLIPSQLFNMLDDDDEDGFVLPESPTLGGNRDGWEGLGLDVRDLGAPIAPLSTASTVTTTAKTASATTSPITTSAVVPSPITTTLPLTTAPPPSLIHARSSSISPVLSNPSPVALSLPSPSSDTSSMPALSPLAGGPANEAAQSPWDSTDQLLSHHHRLSPLNDDDIPRHGLSLNPDAKAFAFQPRPGRSSSSRSGSGSGSALPSAAHLRTSPPPTTASIAFNSVIGPPAKSRMEFSSSANVTNGGGARTAFGFGGADWGKTSPRVTTPLATPTAQLSFNPFDGDDELLGPIKK
ncbi:hypothetical protein MNV49_001898 [Pseudohyphozyma bogoriensis]|nr:hypothetical protein MNV49_001898 [Pseudohyphozyma bogoriensis]